MFYTPTYKGVHLLTEV